LRYDQEKSFLQLDINLRYVSTGTELWVSLATSSKKIINFAIFLAMIAALKSATLIMAGKVAIAHHRGLVSMKELNRSLMGNKKYCENISWKDKACKK